MNLERDLRRWKRLVLPLGGALLLTTASTPAHAERVQDYQLWVRLALERQVERVKDLQFRLELDSRAVNTPRTAPDDDLPERDYQNPSTVINVRPEVGYRFDDLAIVYFSFTYQPQFYWDARRDDVQEVRVHEEITGEQELSRTSLNYRTRLEQRYRFRGDGEGEWAHRLRLRGRFEVIPIVGAPWRIRIEEEVMFSLNDTDYQTWTGFDRNRALLGLGYKSSENVQIVTAFMNEFAYQRGDPNQLNYILWVTIEVELEQSTLGRGKR